MMTLGDILVNSLYFYALCVSAGILVGMFWAIFLYWTRL